MNTIVKDIKASIKELQATLKAFEEASKKVEIAGKHKSFKEYNQAEEEKFLRCADLSHRLNEIASAIGDLQSTESVIGISETLKVRLERL